MLNANFAILASIIAATGAAYYLVLTIQGKVKPNRVTYLLWSVAPLVAFAAQVYQGVGIQSLMTFTVGFMPLLVFLASFINKKSEWKATRFDLICGCLSVIGLVLWQITRNGNIAIVISILADLLAGIPTLIKSYQYPETENSWNYFAGAVSGLLTLLTVTHWNFATYAFPAYIMVISFILGALVQFKVGKMIRF